MNLFQIYRDTLTILFDVIELKKFRNSITIIKEMLKISAD
jgi:hypothetical protein